MSQPLPDEWESAVVGVSFVEGYPDNLIHLDRYHRRAEAAGNSVPVELVREPDNMHDPNAVAVHLVMAGDERRPLGHLPASVAERLAPSLDAGDKWEAEVDEVKVDPEREHPGLTILAWRI